jgi:TRAP-type transport system periplasmic protein
MRQRWLGAAMLAAAVTAATTGCSGRTGADKAGGSQPVVLRMADGYEPGLDLEPAVAYFVRRVQALSKGNLRIRVRDAWGHTKPGFEQQIVRDVAADKADLGWVGTRIFDTLGVNSFQALTAPMLIDSYTLERAVIESAIPSRMMSSLDRLGITGLAVLGDGLRKPIAVKQPLLRPAEWRGITFAVFRSHGQAEAIRALGAQTTDIWGPALQDAIAQGRIEGFEKHYFLWDLVIDPQAAPDVAANVNLWPETVALFANPRRLAALSGQQRDWVRQAAADAAAHSTGLFQVEGPQIIRLCKEGARFTNASASDLGAYRRAFAPVYRRLERDPQTNDFISQIFKLKQTIRPQPEAHIPPACAGSAPATSKVSGTPTSPAALDGVYRVTLTDKEMAAAGPIPAYSRPSFGGLITLTMRDGRYIFRPRTPPICTGTYLVSGSSVRFRVNPRTRCQGVVTARWSLVGGQLHLRVISSTNPYDKVVWGHKPWQKIGR